LFTWDAVFDWLEILSKACFILYEEDLEVLDLETKEVLIIGCLIISVEN